MLPSSENDSRYDQGAPLGQAETSKRISRHIADHLMVLASISLHDIALKNDGSSETSNVSKELHWETHMDMQIETASHLSFVSDPYAVERLQHAPMGEGQATSATGPQSIQQKQNVSLRKQIRESYVDSNFPPGRGKSKYLPQDCVESLVTREAIAIELGLVSVASEKPYKGLIDWTLKHASRLFLIVLSSQFVRNGAELCEAMALFRSSSFDDSKLPWTDASDFPDEKVEESDDIWARSEMIEHFSPAQWRFLALVIRSGTFQYYIQPGEILPFTQVEKPKEGAFGKVYRVKIHQSHTDYPFDEEFQTSGGVSQAALEAAWLAEVGILRMVKRLRNPHLIECLAVLERGPDRYLLFPWADGGSLRDYWENTPCQIPTHSLVKEALVQLQGIGDALRGLHYFGIDDNSEEQPDDLPGVHTEDIADEYNSVGAEISIRHGDLKPENLLWFTEHGQNDDVARCLKIADMGLAKRHVVGTQDRSRLTTTTYGTILYEPPEAEPAFGPQPRSRLYDMWSMGCIITEWIIWLLYGNTELQRFHDDLKGPNYDPKKPVSYYESINASLAPSIEDTAIRYRATSIDFERAMSNILLEVENSPDYLLMSSATELSTASLPPPRGSRLHPQMAAPAPSATQPAAGLGVQQLALPTRTARNNYTLPLLEDWRFPVDNDFAEDLAALLGRKSLAPTLSTPAKLCEPCSRLKIWDTGFSFAYKRDKLQQDSKFSDGIPGDARYVALSHRWGDTQKHRPLLTQLSNLESFKQAIPQVDIPQTFADAMIVTRRLGIQYLWIDALCIIQGDGGDFNTEAKRMEDVFGCAYCVIAASRASNQREGFLHKPRPQRRFITIQQEREPPFYVCETVDDFGRHVLDGALNSRGWVLQERALARRTIFFTDSQTYFGCGQGVRCETLAKMQNDMADFLDDPKFPYKAMKEKSRAVRIRYFQDLYRRYSQLEFSHIQDRPIAIAGLENRLLKAYATQGGYGIFDDGPGHGLFHRSLLWQRSEEEDALNAIDFSSRPDSVAPTWSWMAYDGGIDYLDLPFQETEWERTDIEPPWSVTSGDSDGPRQTTRLKVIVRSFSVAGAPERKLGKIKFTYDNPYRKGTSDRQSPLCVVIAKEKGNKSLQEKPHYVLVVIGTGGGIEHGQRCFNRLGVGFLPGKYIGLEEDGVRGIIV
ncbi:tol-like protein [Colletotrichum kahawae]|uniref:Tol-like protein n=1 Tax=Colletotrichum kahawae TaxID=34407 RepID=A0AAD9Y7L4_COLKA|nr:tol-like protein [Colletotrichum kahawae]